MDKKKQTFKKSLLFLVFKKKLLYNKIKIINTENIGGRWLNIQKIKGNTFCIDTQMADIPFYKIENKRIILLDTGVRNQREELENLFKKNHFKVAGILCSHPHVDHIGNVAYFKEKYHCQVAMPAGEAWACRSFSNFKIYNNIHAPLSIVKKHYGHLIFDIDKLILEQQNIINICGIPFSIIHTPGHSPDHISMITPDNVLYIGDALISSEVMKGAKMPYAFNLKEDLESKRKLYNLSCSNYIIAHKGIYEDISKLIDKNIEFYQYRAKRIEDFIGEKVDWEKIFERVVERFHIHITSIFKHDVIERMLKSYLDYLVEMEKIEMILEDGKIKYKKRI